MKIISWNLNSRTNKETLRGQSAFLRSGDFDVITLQGQNIEYGVGTVYKILDKVA
jgi:exonuclease III